MVIPLVHTPDTVALPRGFSCSSYRRGCQGWSSGGGRRGDRQWAVVGAVVVVTRCQRAACGVCGGCSWYLQRGSRAAWHSLAPQRVT